MTDAADGSVAEKPAGNLDAQTQTLDKGSTSESAPSFRDGLSEGNRKLAETKGWTSPESIDKMFSSYSELEGRMGQALTVPKPDAAPEEWEKFYSRAGRPEKSDGYEFKRPDNLPADLPYDDNLAKASKDWMFEAGLNGRQAQVVHDKFVGHIAQQQQEAQQRVAAQVEQTHDQLVKDWGGPTDSAPFKEKLALANRALEKLGLKEAYQASGILLADGSLTNPQIAKAMAAVGETMFKEDSIGDDGGAFSGENPFKRDDKGSIKNVSAISALIKSDPERAKRLARDAGEPIENWIRNNPY